MIQALTNNITYGVTLFALIGFLLAIGYYHHLPRFGRQLLWISILYFLISSSLIPWQFFQSTPLKLIQFPWRLLVFPQLFLIIIFSYTVTGLAEETSSHQVRRWLTFGIVMIAVLLSLDTQHKHVKFEIGSPEINYELNKTQGFNYHHGLVRYKVTNQYEYQNLMGYTAVADYLPQKSRNLFDTVAAPEHYALTNHSNVVIPTRMHGGPDQATIVFHTVKTLSYIELPFVIYNHHYQVTVDGKTTPLIISHHHLLALHHVSAGSHTVHVTYHNPLMVAAVVIFSLIGLIILVLPSKLLQKHFKVRH